MKNGKHREVFGLFGWALICRMEEYQALVRKMDRRTA